MLIADMDSTIIGVECIDELADFAGLKPQVAAITEAAMRGELDFEAALIARVALLKGLPASVLERCYVERVRLNPGARTLVRTMAAHGAETALVSGGFTFFSERVAREAGFARQQANRLEAKDGVLTGEVARPILGRAAKLAALRAVAAEAGIGAGRGARGRRRRQRRRHGAGGRARRRLPRQAGPRRGGGRPPESLRPDRAARAPGHPGRRMDGLSGGPTSAPTRTNGGCAPNYGCLSA